MLNFKTVNIISIVLGCFILFLKVLFDTSLWFLIGLIFLWFFFTTIGSFNIRSNYFFKVKNKNYSVDDVIALTFDDGPDPEITPLVLALLKKHQVKATFFCIGKNVEKHPKLVQQIISEGHIIGNHTYSHVNTFGFFSTNAVKEDVLKCQEIIYKITGLQMKFFRPPFGVTNPNIAKAISALKMETFGWSVRSLDTAISSVSKVYKRIISNLKGGDVILLHDTSTLSVTVLEQLLIYLEENNLRSVTLAELFNTKAYEV